MKYYIIRILAALFFMGSIGVGFINGATYGQLAGWLTFIVMVSVGILLHIKANKTQKTLKA